MVTKFTTLSENALIPPGPALRVDLDVDPEFVSAGMVGTGRFFETTYKIYADEFTVSDWDISGLSSADVDGLLAALARAGHGPAMAVAADAAMSGRAQSEYRAPADVTAIEEAVRMVVSKTWE